MTLERSTRARLTTALILFLVLVAGVVLGVALDRRFEARAMIGGEVRRPGGRPGMMEGRSRGFDSRSRDSSQFHNPYQPGESSQRRSSLIVEQVGLSEAQKEQVDSIVVYYRAQMRSLHDEFDEAYMTRYREIMQMTRDEIKAILTPDQRMAYDSLLVERDRRRAEWLQDSISDTGGQRDEG